jgi:PAS domain S-box-containing protein
VISSGARLLRVEAGPPDRSSRRLVLAAIALALAACALSGYWLWVLHDHRIQATNRQVQLQTASVAELAGMVFDAVDVSLLDTVDDLRHGRLEPATAFRTLHARAEGNRYLLALSLVDAEGRVLASSWSDPPPQLRTGPPRRIDAPLRIAAPARNGYDGREAIELGRAVADAAGDVAEVVAIVDNQFVGRFFSRIAFAGDAKAGLFSLDGTRLAGSLDLASLTATAAIAPTPPFVLRRLLAAGADESTEHGSVFVSAQRLRGVPMVVVTSRERAAVLAPWYEYLVSAGATAIVGLVLLALTVRRLQGEMQARLRAQAALERTREHARLAFEAAQEGAWSWDPGRAMLELSPRMAALLGVASARLPEAFLRGEAVHRDDRALIRRAVVAHVRGRSAQLAMHFRVAAPQGRWRWIHARGRASLDGEGRVAGIAGTASDETEARARSEQLQHLQTRLQRTRRLESLGRLSGGIAHDFNNILAAILGFGDLLRQETAPDSAAGRHVEQVLRAGERGRNLASRILSFGRGGVRASVPVDVEAVVGEALDLLAGTAPASVSLERDLRAADAVVLGDATQLFEAVGNLCANALHAMPEGGVLAVRTALLQNDALRPLSHGSLESGRYVSVAVVDTGRGMSAEVIEHLFEPFFTTRASQGGTGLGLAMVHGAVSEMNGSIDVVSAPGRGAHFTLYLPLSDATALAEMPSLASAPRGSGQVIMVVDDESALVTLTEEVLAGLGYEAVGFRDPLLALKVLQQSPQRFDALLTDQIMPGMQGTELARHWGLLRPDAPILLASGFGGADLERQARDAGVAVLLQKPLHRGELAAELASVLGWAATGFLSPAFSRHCARNAVRARRHGRARRRPHDEAR